ncbi:MAG TPA: hypothetical protein VGR00_15485, partial [Thermoanaerobaculia bacterium]|nr:hypothetical protein [Thermoanaerobaculia bacterium]
FWEPVPFPQNLEGMKVYRVATDGTTLYAGGVFSAFYVYTNVDAVTTDGRNWTRLPDLPLSSVSLSYSCVEEGRVTKLVRVSDDAPPRRYVPATWFPALGVWTTGYTLTLPGETSPGSLAAFGHVFYLGTTAGDLYSSAAGEWSVVSSDLPKKSGEQRSPRLVVENGVAYVVTETGLGRLSNGRIVVAEPRLLGRDVLDVAVHGGILYAYTRRQGGRTEVSRLGATEETIALLDAGETRGFLFFDGDDLYVSGPSNEPRLLSEGRSLSPRAREANPAFGFRVTTGDGTTTLFSGERYATSSTVLFRARRRYLKTIPAVVDAGRYTSELFLGNFGSEPVVAIIRFRSESGATTGALQVSLSPGAEKRFENAAAALRAAGAAPSAGDLVGSLSVEFVESGTAAAPLSDSSLVASVRVVTRTPSGSYGVSLDGLPSGSGLDSGGEASGSGLLPGIRRGGATRTNVAAVNAADGSGYPSSYCGGTCGRSPSIEFSAPNGTVASTLAFTLPPGGRRQWNDVVPGGTGDPVLTAHAQAVPPGGSTWDSQLSDDLLLYAVWNDATTNDGVVFPLQLPSRDAMRDVLFLPFAGVVNGMGGLTYQ